MLCNLFFFFVAIRFSIQTLRPLSFCFVTKRTLDNGVNCHKLAIHRVDFCYFTCLLLVFGDKKICWYWSITIRVYLSVATSSIQKQLLFFSSIFTWFFFLYYCNSQCAYVWRWIFFSFFFKNVMKSLLVLFGNGFEPCYLNCCWFCCSQLGLVVCFVCFVVIIFTGLFFFGMIKMQLFVPPVVNQLASQSLFDCFWTYTNVWKLKQNH